MSTSELIDALSAVHWELWRLHSLLQRGSHRNCIAVADDDVVSVLNDLREAQPRLVTNRGTQA